MENHIEISTDANINSPRINIVRESKWNFLDNSRRKNPENQCLHREGPAPKSGVKKSGCQIPNGSLDSDVEDSSQKIDIEKLKNNRQSRSAGSKAFIIYFAKLAHASDTELVDFDFVESLLDGGAGVNSTDKHGQTVMHEVARNWHPDVAFFLLQHGAEINKPDKWGRTPLHSASAVDHADMIEFLLSNGADIHAKTFGELQSPIHYAAKFNAVRALKKLIDMKAKVNDRDYKQRTPLFVAAEAAREEAARYLVERGAPAGVFDDSGLSAIALMIEKMPKIAKEALEQFVYIDRAFRKEYYYLSYLEADPAEWKDLEAFKKYKKKRKKEGVKVRLCPTTPLKVAVQCQELDILMHPVMQHLISVKWNSFGKWGSFFAAGFHLTYIMIWTWLAIFLPRDDIYYKPPSKFWWRIILEFMGCLMTLYFILKQIWEVKSTRKDQQEFQFWRLRELERDLEFCHPRWPDEQQYLESEIKRIRTSKTGYFKDAWNIMDWLTYVAVLLVIVTRILAVFSGEKLAQRIHPRAYAIALIFMWLHFMKSCRPFTSLGPFITMLGHVMQDTLRFAFLFFEFFIPYVCAFWIIFGGADSVDWKSFHELTYSVWKLTLIADADFDPLVAVDRFMCQILVGSYYAIASVVCMNLYIALLSETFARVYQNAKANAALLQATTILQIEKALSKKRRSNAEKYIQKCCCPLEVQHTSGHDGGDDASGFSKMVRQINKRLEMFEDNMKERIRRDDDLGDHFDSKNNSIDRRISRQEKDPYIENIRQRDQQLESVRNELRSIHNILLSYISNDARPRPTSSYNSAPLQPMHPQAFQSIQSLPLPNSRQTPKQKTNIQRSVVAPEVAEEDLMRKFLNQKLNRTQDFTNHGVRNDNKKRRKRRGRQYRDDAALSEYLSQSWEDVSNFEAQSVC